MIRSVYNSIALPLSLGYRAWALFDEKAKRGIEARKELFLTLEKNLERVPKDRPRVLVHVSSVGEYLQALPLIQAIRENLRHIEVILSFTSPSLEDQLKRKPPELIATYLPLDLKAQINRFLDLIKPRLIVFSTYDIWPNLLWTAKERGIPAVLVNATLAATSARIKPFSRWFFKRLYSNLDKVGAISVEDTERFRSLVSIPVTVTGNCRFDQTLSRCASVSSDDPLLQSLPRWDTTFVAGSTWPEDEKRIIPAFARLAAENHALGMIIAPHEPTSAHLQGVERSLDAAGMAHERLSGMPGQREIRAVVVDSVGVLFKLYRRGDAAFVGGSFVGKVHNVMEPAGMSLPVLVGPYYRNAHEAVLMRERGGLKSAADESQVYAVLQEWITNPEKRIQAGAAALAVVRENAGATERSFTLIEEMIELRKSRQ